MTNSYRYGLLRVAVGRVKTDLRMMLAVAAGVIIAAVVLGGVVIYLRSLELVALGSTIDGLGAVRKNVQVTHRRIPFTRAAFDERDSNINAASEANLSEFKTGSGSFIRSPFYRWGPEGNIRSGAEDSQALFGEMAGIGTHVTYTAGRAPSDQVRFDADGVPVVEAALLAQKATGLDVRLGETLDLEAAGEARGRVKAVVTGFLEPNDSGEDFWNGLADAVLAPSYDNAPPVLPLVVGPDSLWAIGAATPGAVAEVTWIVRTDPAALRKMHPAAILAAYDGFRADVEKSVPRSTVFSGLAPSVRDLENRILFARIPMFLIGALLLGVVAYYMFMVAGLLADRRARDIAMLRSRGISTLQIARLYALEASAIIAVASLGAPFLAQLVVASLGRLPIYRPVTGGEALPTELHLLAFGWSSLAGIAALAILAVPALLHARTDMAGARRSASRPSGTLWFQRFYLDGIVLVLGGLVLWELRTRRTVVTGALTGQQTADMTLLFAPALLLVGVTIVFLRVYPPLLRLLAWATARRAPVWLAMALWRLSRHPFAYAWPMLLLVLAAGLAVVSAALGSTLEQSSRDRSAYESGADVHASGVRVSGGVDGPTVTGVRAVPGVGGAALALRKTGQIGTTGRGNRFDMLAVDAEQFGEVGWFRGDFAARSLPELMDELPVFDEPPPLMLPEDATGIAMWTRAEPEVSRLFLWVVLRDSNARMQTVTLGPIQGGDWTSQVATLPDSLQPPLQVTSILTYEPVTGTGGSPTVVYLDDLTALQGEGGAGTVLVDFERTEMWTPLPTSEGFDVRFDMAPEDAGTGPLPGGRVGQLTLGRGTDGGVRGIYRSLTGAPLPVLASDGLLAANGLRVGDRFVGVLNGVLMPLLVVDSVRLFPTMEPDDGGFAIVDMRTLTTYADLRGATGQVNQTYEIFASVDPEMRDQAVNGIRTLLGPASQVVDRVAIEAGFLIDPLTVAGWRGVGLVATVATLGIAAIGLLTYLVSYLVRSRVETGFLRALGMAGSAQVASVAFEQLSVTLAGLALGSVAGVGMTRMAVDSVSHTESGRPLLPPFVLVVEWLPVGLIFGGLAVVAAAALARLAYDYRRLPLHMLTRREE